MSLIPNFPDVFNDEHHSWHDGTHPGFPMRVNPEEQPGSGLEFLQFHRDFINKVLQWYFQQPFADLNAVAPWHSIPNELKEARLGWNNQWAADEQRIVSFDPPFASADDFGIFIETGIHNNFLHRATADFFNEPTVSTFHSPESTFFYKIHGLVDFWWRQGQGFGNLADGRPIWIGNFSRTDRAEVLFYYPGDGNWWLGSHDGNQFAWSLASNTNNFGQVGDGRPIWIGDFNGNGRADVLFYYPGDGNWWLGSHQGAGGQLAWSFAGNTSGFGNLGDGRPIWIGNFSRTDRAEVLFYFRGDGRWWLGTHNGNQFVWSLIGNTGRF